MHQGKTCIPNPLAARAINGGFGRLTVCLGLLWMLPPASPLMSQAPDVPPPPPRPPQAEPATAPQRFEPLELRIPVREAAVADDRQTRGRVSTVDAQRTGLVLHATTAGEVRMEIPAQAAGQFWTLLPVEGNVVRLQLVRRGRLWSLSATDVTGPMTVAPTRQETRQLWRAVSDGGGGIRLDSLAYPGRSLAGAADGWVRLERSSRSDAQYWLVQYQPPPADLSIPVVRLRRPEYRMQEPLPPAQVRLRNSHRNELLVVLGDLRTGQVARQLRIPAGGISMIDIPRDPGGVLIERYEILTPNGYVAIDEIQTLLPPASWFDLSVYEIFLQSIAIDRTGKSPQAIEDVNYQPRSIGFFVLPPGNRLADDVVLDPYQTAMAQQNPGGVRPLQRQSPTRPSEDILERTLRELRR